MKTKATLGLWKNVLQRLRLTFHRDSSSLVGKIHQLPRCKHHLVAQHQKLVMILGQSIASIDMYLHIGMPKLRNLCTIQLCTVLMDTWMVVRTHISYHMRI